MPNRCGSCCSLFTSSSGAQLPLAAFAMVELNNTPLPVKHQSSTPADIVSFNLPLGVPVSVRGSFASTAQALKNALSSQRLLILAAIVTIYLVPGILYENLVLPIRSTLPSAGVGALLALEAFNT